MGYAVNGDEVIAPPPKKTAAFPLTLVSPHPRGPAVKEAQRALTNNPFRDFMEGSPVDGEFGPWTARATRRAKWELGWRSCTQQYGIDLHEVLTGKKKLNPARRVLRRKRLKAGAKFTRGELALRAAARDVGLTEDPPGSNRNRISVGFGIVGAWCAMAVSTWAKRAGSAIPIVGKGVAGRYYYCPTILNDATAGANGLTLVKPAHAKAGDWPLFDWGDDRVADHVETYVCRPGNREALRRALEVLADFPTVRDQVAAFALRAAGRPDAFITIGGNTSFEGMSGSQSDGGAVAVRIRYTGDLVRNVRGDYGIARLER